MRAFLHVWHGMDQSVIDNAMTSGVGVFAHCVRTNGGHSLTSCRDNNNIYSAIWMKLYHFWQIRYLQVLILFCNLWQIWVLDNFRGICGPETRTRTCKLVRGVFRGAESARTPKLSKGLKKFIFGWIKGPTSKGRRWECRGGDSKGKGWKGTGRGVEGRGQDPTP